jgi:hypothetical protein
LVAESLRLEHGACDEDDEFGLHLPAADANVEAANDVLLFFAEVPVLDVWPQIVEPSQPAAFATPLQPWNQQIMYRSSVTI